MSTAFLTPESTGTKIIHRTAITERKKTTGNTKTKPRRRVGFWQQFINFAAAEERNRFGWLAAAITLQGCVLAPLTLLAIISNGNPFILWIPCIIAFAITEVVFLAAMPTRITIPVLFAGIVTDIIVVLVCFTLF